MAGDGQVTINVRLTPRAGRDKIIGWRSDEREQLVVCVQPPPSRGQANAALLKLLAQALGLPKSRVSLARGARSRDKQLVVGMDAEDFQEWAAAVPVIEKE